MQPLQISLTTAAMQDTKHAMAHEILQYSVFAWHLEGQLVDELPGADVKVRRPRAIRSRGAATAAAAALIAAEVV